MFDRVLGVYVTPSQKKTYWFGDRFYRLIDSVWMSAPELAGPWSLTASVMVPVSLREVFPPPKKKVRATLPSGVVLIYEPALRVYQVWGRADVYMFEGRYLRYMNGVWLASAGDDGPWELSTMKGIPLLLRRKVRPPEAGARVSVPSGTVLEYDAGLAMFRVADKPDVYFHDGLYFERRDLKWFNSKVADSGFEEIAVAKVPPSLRALYRAKEGVGKPGKGVKKPPGQAKQARPPGAAKAGQNKPAKPKEPKPPKAPKEPKAPKPAKEPGAAKGQQAKAKAAKAAAAAAAGQAAAKQPAASPAAPEQ